MQVELLDNDLAKVYMNSADAQAEFPNLHPLARQAISVARRLQDPLFEYARAFNADDDILELPLHLAKDMLPKEELRSALEREMINAVNTVGVDINRCLEHPHCAHVLQFVGGLGPRKAEHLLRVFRSRQNKGIMEGRWQLVKKAEMGAQVYMNCAGFIKIDPALVGEKTELYVEVRESAQ